MCKPRPRELPGGTWGSTRGQLGTQGRPGARGTAPSTLMSLRAGQAPTGSRCPLGQTRSSLSLAGPELGAGTEPGAAGRRWPSLAGADGSGLTAVVLGGCGRASSSSLLSCSNTKRRCDFQSLHHDPLSPVCRSGRTSAPRVTVPQHRRCRRSCSALRTGGLERVWLFAVCVTMNDTERNRLRAASSGSTVGLSASP